MVVSWEEPSFIFSLIHSDMFLNFLYLCVIVFGFPALSRSHRYALYEDLWLASYNSIICVLEVLHKYSFFLVIDNLNRRLFNYCIQRQCKCGKQYLIAVVFPSFVLSFLFFIMFVLPWIWNLCVGNKEIYNMFA